MQGVHDAVGDQARVDGRPDGAQAAHGVDDVEMMVVPPGPGPAGVDVLAQGRAEHAPFEIVHGQGVAGQHGVHVAAADEADQGPPGVEVEDRGRPQDPDDAAVLPLVAQQGVELVVVRGKRRLAADAAAEDELLGDIALFLEPPGVHEDPVLAVLAATHGHGVAQAEVAELAHGDRVALAHEHAVHARVRGQDPMAGGELDVFGVDGCGVVVRRRHAVGRGRLEAGRGGVAQFGGREVGRAVFGQGEFHGHLLSGTHSRSGAFRATRRAGRRGRGRGRASGRPPSAPGGRTWPAGTPGGVPRGSRPDWPEPPRPGRPRSRAGRG